MFRHHGTLDKFIGDGMMATFGTPDPGQRDATNALGLPDADRRSSSRHGTTRRIPQGKEPIQIAVGLHYGPVVVGNIGTDRRLEFARARRHRERRKPARDADARAWRGRPRSAARLATAVMDEATGEEVKASRGLRRSGTAVALKGRDEKVDGADLRVGRPVRLRASSRSAGRSPCSADNRRRISVRDSAPRAAPRRNA